MSRFLAALLLITPFASLRAEDPPKIDPYDQSKVALEVEAPADFKGKRVLIVAGYALQKGQTDQQNRASTISGGAQLLGLGVQGYNAYAGNEATKRLADAKFAEAAANRSDNAYLRWLAEGKPQTTTVGGVDPVSTGMGTGTAPVAPGSVLAPTTTAATTGGTGLLSAPAASTATAAPVGTGTVLAPAAGAGSAAPLAAQAPASVAPAASTAVPATAGETAATAAGTTAAGASLSKGAVAGSVGGSLGVAAGTKWHDSVGVNEDIGQTVGGVVGGAIAGGIAGGGYGAIGGAIVGGLSSFVDDLF